MDAVPCPPAVKAEASTAPETAPAAKANHPTGFRKAKSGSSGAGSKTAEPETTDVDASSVTAAEETRTKASTNGEGGDAVKTKEPELDENGNPVLYTKSGAKRKQASNCKAQYNPEVQMTEKQLTQWRREMRRVRNREAAAASRKKVRDRIDDLENRASKWRSRYEDAINRIGEAERERLGLPTAEDLDAEDEAAGGRTTEVLRHPGTRRLRSKPQRRERSFPRTMLQFKAGETADDNPVWLRWQYQGMAG
ncbi:hypothetical protein THAOC_08062 [Thalassiosira oceanica]|uniref:BZIP domain-containing protein n=1 Tax=Thalassiosira oceanica TaxID=159749 RepID=K0TAT9_THAOC|nr:hypothetical protein THAOC_08062 [Thalassiosira oceanica]|eukprot:EJK70566.1 hypothetical protein THAOC_08062 [Thalassiosira oceanica]